MIEKNIFSKNSDLTLSFRRYKQDLTKRGISRLLNQFRESPVLIQLIQSICAEVQELYDAGVGCLIKRTLEGEGEQDRDGRFIRAEGVNLDIIGDIVGQPRLLYNYNDVKYFSPDTENTVDNAPVWVQNGPLYGNLTADDNTYRKLILSKIFKNHVVGCTFPEVRYFAKLLTQQDLSFISQVGISKVELVVKKGFNVNDVRFLLTSLSDVRVDSSYVTPMPPEVELDQKNFWVLPVDQIKIEDEETGKEVTKQVVSFFAPDREDCIFDKSKIAIRAEMKGL